MNTTTNHLLGRLRYHVTGAIERGEAEAITEIKPTNTMKLSRDVLDFLEAYEFANQSDDEWTIYTLPESFTSWLESFLVDAWEAIGEDWEASEHTRNFGHDVYFSLSGHGVGIWEHDKELQASLETFAEDEYLFEQMYIYTGDDGQPYVAGITHSTLDA